MLAGISADYYLRLERGRDRNPSDQVLEALGRVLRLDDEHVDHMRAIVERPRRRIATDGAAHGFARGPLGLGSQPEPQRQLQLQLQLLDGLVQPAFIETTTFDIVAANTAARRLSPRLTPGRNQLRDLLTDADDLALYPDHDAITQCLVGNLRQTAAASDDQRATDLAEELGARSDRFRLLWDRHDVQGQSSGAVRMHHPEVGPLTLDRSRLAIEGVQGIRLVVLHAAPGSAAAAKLARLGS